LRLSWREILGLLIGLAISYGVISYALTNAPQNRETASEQTRTSTQQSGVRQHTAPVVSDRETKTVILRVTGSKGQPFSANYGTLEASRSVDGLAPADYEARIRTDPRSADSLSATVWKTTGDSKALTVQIIDNGRVVKESSTAEDSGATYVRWSPNEPQPSGTTMQEGTEKTKGS
jgi:hypothetical protein